MTPLTQVVSVVLLLCSSLLAQAGEDEVIVESTHSEATAETRGVSRTDIDMDEQFSAGEDVASAVSLAPGTQIRRLGGLGSWAGVSIRGATFRQVVVAIDGLPLNPDGTGAIDLSTLPLAAFQQVQVYRGAVPLRFGVVPLGGVVNLRTQTTSSRSIQLGVGQWNTARIQGSIGGPQWFTAADLFTTQSAFRYFSNNQTPFEPEDDAYFQRENAEKYQASIHSRATMNTGHVTWTLQNSTFVRSEGLPGPISRPSSQTRLTTGRNIAQLALDHVGETGALWGRLHHTVRVERYQDPEGELGVGRQDQRDEAHTMGLRIGGLWTPSPFIQPEFNLQVRVQDLQRNRHPVQTSERLFSRIIGAGQLEVPLYLLKDRLTIRPGFATTLSPGQVPGWAPQLTIQGVLSPMGSVWMSIGRGFRLPDLWELYGDRGNSVGNPDLLPESGIRSDLGTRWHFPSLQKHAVELSLVGFYKRDQDRIVYIQNATSTMVPVNFGDSQSYGLEMAVTWSWKDRLSLQGQSTLTWTQNLDPRPSLFGNQLPRVPLSNSTLQMVLHPIHNIQVGLGTSHTAGNYWDATNWYLSPPRQVQNAWIRWAPHSGPLHVEFSVLNLTNRLTANALLDPLQPELGTGPYPLVDFSGYPLPGRTAMLQISWRE